MESTEKVTEVTPKDTGTTYQKLRERCDKLGIPMNRMFMEAKVNRTVVDRWKTKEPKTLEIHGKLLDALERIENGTSHT